ncbi:MAG: SH3 domain-containing protein [Nitrospinaceae bacterium]
MKIFEMKFLIALGAVLALAISGCASGGSQKKVQQFDKPPSTVPETDKKLFLKALEAQKVGQYEAAIQLWKDYLVKNPNSHEGHNNLGLVYYTQDMISQALQEFETAYRLEPVDLGIRRNLARGLRFRANMFHENREYFKTLDILARLEGIVPEDDKQGVLMKMEQVEDQIFLQVIKADNASAYLDFVQRFPDGLNAVRAQEFLDKHPNQVSRANLQKKNRSSHQPGMIQSVESGSFAPGGSSQAPPDYGSPTYYGSSQPSATYSPPSSKPARVARKKKIDFFGVDPSAEESITEENLTAFQGATETLIIIPSENFTKPERIDGKSDDSAMGKHRVGEDPPIRAQAEVLAGGPDTHPDFEAPPMAAVDAESTDIKLEPAGQEEAPPAESTAPEVKLSAIEQAIKEAEAEMAQAANAEPAEPMMAEQEKTEAPPAESTAPEVKLSAIEQAIKEAEAELAQAQSTSVESSLKEIMANESAAAEPVVEEKAEPETSAEQPMAVASLNQEAETAQPDIEKEKDAPVSSSEPAPAETKTLDPDSVSQTVASLIPSKPGDIKGAGAESQTSPHTVVVIQVRQGATLNVRAEPSASGEILGYLENGDMMPFTKESGDWYQIRIDEEVFGWVNKKFSRTENIASDVPLAFSEDGETEGAQADRPASAGSLVEITVREGSTLNVRSMPSPDGAVVDMLSPGDTLPLVKESGDWYQLQFEDGTTGWVSKKFSRIQTASADVPGSFPEVEDEETANAEAPMATSPQTPITTVVVITVKEGSSLNVRSAPSSQGQVLGRLKNGDMRPLLEESGEWYQVEFQDGQSGWVSQKFSAKVDMGSNLVPTP